MKVVDCIRNGDGKTVSVEIEPPKIGYPREEIFQMLDPLVELGIEYVDITYHSARVVECLAVDGKRVPLYQRLQPGTSGMAGAIAERYANKKVFPVPHAICTGFTIYDTEDFLHELACLGVNNILALRGDGYRDEEGSVLPFVPELGGHASAKDLIAQVASLKKGEYVGARIGEKLDFGIGAACYPEKHPQAASLEDDVRWTKAKGEAGAEYFVTQMFFDCSLYEDYINLAEKVGIKAPIIPGIKPLTTYRQVSLLPEIFQCRIPKELRDNIEKHKDNKEDIRKVGIEWAVQQCENLRNIGSPSLHFYSSRKAPIKEILMEIC